MYADSADRLSFLGSLVGGSTVSVTFGQHIEFWWFFDQMDQHVCRPAECLRRTMDKLSMISGALFLAADIFAVTSLAMPHWIVSEIGGDTNIGLLKTCLTIYRRPSICFVPDPVRGEWLLTFVCIVLGVLCINVTIVLLAFSYWQCRVIKFARWLGFLAMILFCLAAVIFPIGFDMDQIGGEAYQLPNNFRVGISYIFFMLALWITVVSQLFASKVCLPHF